MPIFWFTHSQYTDDDLSYSTIPLNTEVSTIHNSTSITEQSDKINTWKTALTTDLNDLLGDESKDYAMCFIRPYALDESPFLYHSRPMRSASTVKIFIIREGDS